MFKWLLFELEGWKCIISVVLFTKVSIFLRVTNIWLGSELFIFLFDRSIQKLQKYIDKSKTTHVKEQAMSNKFWYNMKFTLI